MMGKDRENNIWRKIKRYEGRIQKGFAWLKEGGEGGDEVKEEGKEVKKEERKFLERKEVFSSKT